MIIKDAQAELDGSLKALAALMTTATPPHEVSIREELLRAIAAASVAATERDALVEALDTHNQVARRGEERLELLSMQRDSIMGYIRTIAHNAEETLASYAESLAVPSYNETAQTRLLAARLREIGTGCKSVHESYIAAATTPAVSVSNDLH